MEAIQRAAMQTKVEELIALNPLVMFSKSSCPFCVQAKKALADVGVNRFPIVELDKMGEARATDMQDHLAAITGARTVPRVFVGKKCIGGGTETVNLAKSGELKQLVADAVAKHEMDLDGKGKFQLIKSEDDWKAELGANAYKILRKRGTERPGSHEYDQYYPKQGYFACRACSLPLYSASSKFKSSCGWPVFDKCYFSKEIGCHVGTRPDGSGALEILCPKCGGHLGHVFFDAHTPENPNGERH